MKRTTFKKGRRLRLVELKKLAVEHGQTVSPAGDEFVANPLWKPVARECDRSKSNALLGDASAPTSRSQHGSGLGAILFT
jgi:hypothetical protein